MCAGTNSQESRSRPSKSLISWRSGGTTPHRTGREAVEAVGVVSLCTSRAKESLPCAPMPVSGRIRASSALVFIHGGRINPPTWNALVVLLSAGSSAPRPHGPCRPPSPRRVGVGQL